MHKILIPIFSLFLLLFSACQNNGNTAKSNQLENRDTQTQRVPQTAPEPKREQGPQTTANRLAGIAVRVPHVNDATAIVFGKYAIVGIDVDANLERSKVGTIKYSVAEALKDDPQGANSLVTSDLDIIQRIREINADVKKGRPIQGFAEELADIVGRIMPQPPGNVRKKEVPKVRENEQKQNNLQNNH